MIWRFFFCFFLNFIFIILCSQTAVLLPYKGRFVYMYKKRGKGHHELHLYKNQAVVTTIQKRKWQQKLSYRFDWHKLPAYTK